jgi:hypothetical protein
MVKFEELKTSQETKMKATTVKLKSKSNNLKVKQETGSQEAQVITAPTADACSHAALRRQQLANNNMVQILQEVEAKHHPEWKDMTAIPFTKATGSNKTP